MILRGFLILAMNLITYTGCYGVSDLCDRGRISVSTLTQCNDPFELFECSPIPSGEVLMKEMLEDPKKRRFLNLLMEKYFTVDPQEFWRLYGSHSEQFHAVGMFAAAEFLTRMERHITNQSGIDDNMKVLCCTRPNVEDSAEIAMWSYYGERHHGIRIHLKPEFYKREHILSEDVIYSNFPPSRADYEEGEVGFVYFIQALCQTKSRGWEHEEEVRLFIDNELLTEAPDCNGKKRCWIEVKKEHLARVDLGIRHEKHKATYLAFKESFPDTPIFYTQRALDAYRCEYKEFDEKMFDRFDDV